MNKLEKNGGLKRAIAIGMLAAIIATITITIAPAMAQSTPPAPSEQVKRGESLFEKNGCYLCHGTVGQGGVGPAIAIDLVPYAGLAAYVRHPTGDMPPFAEKILSDADLHDIYAYLGAQPAPKPADNFPLLPKVKPVSSDSK